MKILAVADEESKYLWDHFDSSLFEDVDLIISSGDLKAKYLSFLTTVAKKPVYYVPGNHDSRYETNPPYGCDLLDDKIVVFNGVRILGLGGSYRYKEGPFQYNERQMRRRIRRLDALINQFGGFDILVTHAPAKGYGDGEDMCHRGFDVFNELIHKYKPSYMLHGHQHMNYTHKAVRTRTQDQTTLINGYNYYFFDYEPNQYSYTGYEGIRRTISSFIFHLKYRGTEQMKFYKQYKKEKAD